jgi:hypothetical protein
MSESMLPRPKLDVFIGRTRECSSAANTDLGLRCGRSGGRLRQLVQYHLLHVDHHLGQQEAERMVAISAEHGFPHQERAGKIVRNIAILDRRADRKVLTELAALIRGSGARIAFPIHCAALAKGYGEIGEP